MKETYHILSNTHWDREWYQSHEKYLVRLVSLFDRLFDLMEKEPDYKFVTDGQFALLDDYLRIRPEKRETAEKLVKEGRLQTGPWYTQPLENIVGGEALIRNLQYGIAEAEKLGGAMRFSYEIDEFGHASQLPQILSGFGIGYSMAWRGIPKDTKSVFKWTSPDGSSVKMFYSKAGYGFATGLPEKEEDYDEIIDGSVIHRDGLKNCVKSLIDYTGEYSENAHRFWLNGIDHSWAQENLFDVMEKIRKLYPGIDVRQSTPQEFAACVEEDIRNRNLALKEVKGELIYTREDILESTNALHPRQKLRHAETEYHLVHRLEPLSAFAWTLGAENKRWIADRAWKYVLENHAHDSLGCCSVDEVFEQVMARYGAAISLSEQAEQDALRYIMSCSDEKPAVFIFNMSSYPVRGAHRFSLDIPSGFGNGNFSLLSPDGSEIEISVIDRKYGGDVRYNPEMGHPTWGEKCVADVIIDLPEVPPMGYLRLEFVPEKAEDRVRNRRYYNMETSPRVMENEYLKIAINSDGTFGLADKRTGKVYPGQLRFEDTGEAGDVYVHIEPENDGSRIYSAGNAEITCLFDTPLGVSYEIRTEMMIPDGITEDRKNRSENKKPLTVITVLTLLKGSRRLDMKIRCENRSRNHRLRVLFPSFLTFAEYSAGGQPFDCAFRPIREEFDPELPREQAYPTKPMLGYCFVSDGKAGLSVAAKGIFEYECTDDDSHSLALTLIRANDVIDLKTFAITPEYICHEAQNLCTMEFELSLIPFDGTAANAVSEAAGFNLPPVGLMNRQTEDSVMPGYVRPVNILPPRGSLVNVEDEEIEITCFKAAKDRDSLICRFLNISDEARRVPVGFDLPGCRISALYDTDLEEKRQEKLADNGKTELLLPAHGLKTVEIVFR